MSTPPTKKPSTASNLSLLAIPGLLVLLLFLSAATSMRSSLEPSTAPQTRTETPATSSADQLAEIFMAWELQPPPEREWFPQQVTLPQIMPGTEPNMVLKALVTQHPEYMVHQEMATAIETGRMMIVPTSSTGAAANFTVLDAEEILQSTMPITTNEVPALRIGLADLVGVTSRNQIVHWMLVIYHEGWHWKQWMNATDPEVRQNFKRKLVGAGVTDRECEIMLEHELEAYDAECVLARNWGQPELAHGDMCLYDDGIDRDRYMFVQMAYAYRDTMGGCFQKWATMVEHPNPSVFAQFN